MCALAASKLKRQLKTHKGFHGQGIENNQRDDDGAFVFCVHCCFNNKRVKHVYKKPEKDSVEEEVEASDDETGDDVITDEQARAFRRILSTILGPLCEEYVSIIIESIKGGNFKDAKAIVARTVHAILEDPEKQEDLHQDLAGKSNDAIEALIERTISRLIKRNAADTDHKKIKDWSKNYQKEPDTVVLEESEEEEEVTTPLPSTRPPPEKQDATKANMLEALEVLRIEIEETMKQTWSPGLEAVAESQKGRLSDKLIVVQPIFSDMNAAEKIEVEDNKTVQVKAAFNALAKLEEDITFMNFKSGRTSGGPVATIAEKEEDPVSYTHLTLPTKA